MNNSKRILF